MQRVSYLLILILYLVYLVKRFRTILHTVSIESSTYPVSHHAVRMQVSVRIHLKWLGAESPEHTRVAV